MDSLMTKGEKKLVANLLNAASDVFGNHGCNDFDLAEVIPSVRERNRLVREMHEWNGDPEEYYALKAGEADYRMPDFALFAFLAYKIEHENK